MFTPPPPSGHRYESLQPIQNQSIIPLNLNEMIARIDLIPEIFELESSFDQFL
jgi:hypothetical protein